MFEIIVAFFLIFFNFIIYMRYNSLIYLIFSPFFIFSIINYLIYFLAPFALENILNKNLDHINEIHLIIIINEILIFLYMLIFQKKLINLKLINKNRLNYFDIFIPLLVIMLPVLIILLINFLQYGIGDFNEMYKSSRKGGNAWKIMMGYVLAYIPFIYLYVTNKFNIKFYILILLAFFGIFLTGARIGFVEILLMFIFFMIYIGKISINKLLFIFSFGIVLIIGMTVVRMLGSESQDITINLLEGLIVFFTLSFDMSVHFDKIITYTNNHELLYGRTLLDFIYYFMPSSLFPDKPMSSEAARTIYDYAAETGVGYNFGMFAISYLNFGLVGSILLPFIYFLIFNYMYNKFVLLKLKNKPNILHFIYIYMSIKIIIALRLGIMTHFLGLITLQLIFILFLYYYVYIYIKSFRKNLYKLNFTKRGENDF